MNPLPPDSQPSPSAIQPDADLAVQDLLARKEAALESLNSRIARLAIALGLELDTEQGLQQALQPGAHAGPHAHSHAFAEELRALLTLRFQMERQLVDELGLNLTHQMVAQVEDHMARVGFRPGADGMHSDQPA